MKLLAEKLPPTGPCMGRFADLPQILFRTPEKLQVKTTEPTRTMCWSPVV